MKITCRKVCSYSHSYEGPPTGTVVLSHSLPKRDVAYELCRAYRSVYTNLPNISAVCGQTSIQSDMENFVDLHIHRICSDLHKIKTAVLLISLSPV